VADLAATVIELDRSRLAQLHDGLGLVLTLLGDTHSGLVRVLHLELESVDPLFALVPGPDLPPHRCGEHEEHPHEDAPEDPRASLRALELTLCFLDHQIGMLPLRHRAPPMQGWG